MSLVGEPPERAIYCPTGNLKKVPSKDDRSGEVTLFRVPYSNLDHVELRDGLGGQAGRQAGRQADRERERQRQANRERERERQTDSNRDRDRETETVSYLRLSKDLQHGVPNRGILNELLNQLMHINSTCVCLN